MKLYQRERPQARDPATQVIRGAEPFDLGKGKHAVLFVHGWTSSPRELRFLAEKVAAAGFRCRGILLKGHGLNLKALEKVEFSEHLQECEDAFSELAMAHERVSICGLSLGGLLALNLARRRRVANLVLLAPFLRPRGHSFGIPHEWLVGRVPLPDVIPKEAPGPIFDEKELETHIAYHAMPSAGLNSIMEAARRMRDQLDQIDCPTLVLHSVHDRTSDFAGSLDLMRTLASEDKTLVALNRSNHVITLDYDRERVETSARDWLAHRLALH